MRKVVVLLALVALVALSVTASANPNREVTTQERGNIGGPPARR